LKAFFVLLSFLPRPPPLGFFFARFLRGFRRSLPPLLVEAVSDVEQESELRLPSVVGAPDGFLVAGVVFGLLLLLLFFGEISLVTASSLFTAAGLVGGDWKTASSLLLDAKEAVVSLLPPPLLSALAGLPDLAASKTASSLR